MTLATSLKGRHGRLRVVHVYKDIYPVKGGIENYVLALAKEQREAHDLDARILVTNTVRETWEGQIEGVPTVKASRLAAAASTPVSTALFASLRALQPDLVHLHIPYPVGELTYLLATGTTPMVATYHSDVVRQATLMRFYAPAFDLVLRRAGAILATSPQYMRSSPWLRRHRARVRIVPLGIDQRPFRDPSPAVLRLAAGLRARYGPRVLHSHGVFRYYKGLHTLIEAVKLVPDARLVLTGTGPEDAALHAQAAVAGLGDRVVFPGPVSDDDLPAYYRAASLYVLPAVARSEAFGLSMVEAQASGLPCISTDLGTGTSYVNLEGVSGLVVPPSDPPALAHAATTLLDDVALRHRLGHQAQERAGKLFTLRADTVVFVYRDILR